MLPLFPRENGTSDGGVREKKYFSFLGCTIKIMFLSGLLCKNNEGKICLEMCLSADNAVPEKIPVEDFLEEFLDRQVLIRIDPVELR